MGVALLDLGTALPASVVVLHNTGALPHLCRLDEADSAVVAQVSPDSALRPRPPVLARPLVDDLLPGTTAPCWPCVAATRLAERAASAQGMTLPHSFEHSVDFPRNCISLTMSVPMSGPKGEQDLISRRYPCGGRWRENPLEKGVHRLASHFGRSCALACPFFNSVCMDAIWSSRLWSPVRVR